MRLSLIPLYGISAALAACSATADCAEEWLTDLPTALQQAEAENKLVLADFTGSDWCTSCIRLRRDVLDTADFRRYAAARFIFLEIDLPQGNGISAELKEKNKVLAEQYHIAGFPSVLVLTPLGKVAGGFEGYRSLQEVLAALKQAQAAAKLLREADALSGLTRARQLMQVYQNFPSSKTFAAAREQLRAEIMAADPHDATGIHKANAILEQANRFQQERNALPIGSPAMEALLLRQLKEAYPENRICILQDRCQHALATVQTVQDVKTVKKMFEELLPLLPAEEAENTRHFIRTYLEDEEALLNMLKHSR